MEEETVVKKGLEQFWGKKIHYCVDYEVRICQKKSVTASRVPRYYHRKYYRGSMYYLLAVLVWP